MTLSMVIQKSMLLSLCTSLSKSASDGQMGEERMEIVEEGVLGGGAVSGSCIFNFYLESIGQNLVI